jgi:general secretion pathway protein J
MYSRRYGFTLLEMLIASLIGAFVILVGLGAMRVVSAGAQLTENNFDAATELRSACSRIETDLANIYRDDNIDYMKFVGKYSNSEESAPCVLTFYTVGRIKARPDQPEGDVYEVEYFLKKSEDKSLLMRRLWPNPDPNSTPGGIVSVIAEDIGLFNVRYFDGKDWQTEWLETAEKMPSLVEVTLAAKIKGTNEISADTFIVKLPEISSQTSQTTAETTTQTNQSGSSSGQNSGTNNANQGQ